METSKPVTLPAQQVSQEALLMKYCKGEETSTEDVFRRVAAGLASVEKEPALWEPRFHEALASGFIPAGRIMSACGTDIQATLINCFVQPVGDAIEEQANGKPDIYTALHEAAITMRRGGGVGYSFSDLRPKGALVKGTSSSASGPLSFMEVFDSSCGTVESAGSRRGAQMGVLRCDHPDIFDFIKVKSAAGKLTNFNISVAMTDQLMAAVIDDRDFELVHDAEPGPELKTAGAHRRADGKWVYRTVKARELFDAITKHTYEFSEPGVLFVDTANKENNLWYCETFEATNPCAEEWLPSYGCCCLGSVDITRFIRDAFTMDASIDMDGFKEVIKVAVRMLDNVLDKSYWPLEKQKQESENKRRVGLGFTGLGDALIMLGEKYDSDTGRRTAARISEVMRDTAYETSVELAKERGAFPMFDADKYLEGQFVQRLPTELREQIREHGIRNSHLLAIAPTGTISLAFADNASNGIEPPFSLYYSRNMRQPDGSVRKIPVWDRAYRLYRVHVGDVDTEDKKFVEQLPEYFRTALTMTASDHLQMVAAVAPFIDTSISKTVNVPEDYPFEDFKSIYFDAWKYGTKGLATHRPNPIRGSVLVASEDTSKSEAPAAAVREFDQSDADHRIKLVTLPTSPLASLRSRGRPMPAGGNDAWSYMIVCSEKTAFAVFIGHEDVQGSREPFEVWVNGAEQPRGLGALAKSLSMDMRSNDRHWLKTKLDSLKRTPGEPFVLAMPPDGEMVIAPSLVGAFARIVEYRCEQLGAFPEGGRSPLLDSLLSRKEPRTGPDGTLAWTTAIYNPATGDDFTLFLKELTMPDGQRRPYSIWLSGNYPRVLDGLCRSLSYDMRVIDPAWIAKKLRQLLDFPEPQGDFLAPVPGGDKRQQRYASTIAYLATLLHYRYLKLGILDSECLPMEPMGVFEHESNVTSIKPKNRSVGAMEVTPGRLCEECGVHAVIKAEGCDLCTSCGAKGACG